MNALIINYIIRSGISLGILYLFFIAFLGKEKMHKFNRFYLLGSLIFSFIVPLLTLPVLIPSTALIRALDVTNFQVNNAQSQITTLQEGNQINIGLLISSFYYFVSSILLIRFLFNLKRLEIGKSRQPLIECDGYKIVLVNEQVLPYSFLSTIYVNSVEYKEGRIPKELFSHEITHITQRHSFDIIFIELLKIFFWFNPLLYYFKKSIMLNHEYLADEEVTKNQTNSKSYIDLLLHIAFRNNKSYLASSFNYSFTKKRLLMITEDNFSKTVILKKVAVVPLFFILGLFLVNAQEAKTPKDAKIPFVVVEEMPEFPGGNESMLNWITENIKYPKKALRQKAEGKVIVRFVVNSEGRVGEVVVLRSDNQLFDEEAIRIVRSMPVWKPGSQSGKKVDVYSMVPVEFQLK